MNFTFKSLAVICLFGNILTAQATELVRKLQGDEPQSGQFCYVSADIECTITGTDKLCSEIGVQPYGTCGERLLTVSYEICNKSSERNIVPLRLNPTGEEGTIAMYRQIWGKPELLLGPMGPDVCRTATVTELVDTCRKRIVGELKFEGW